MTKSDEHGMFKHWKVDFWLETALQIKHYELTHCRDANVAVRFSTIWTALYLFTCFRSIVMTCK
jgi:hypothetical protein